VTLVATDAPALGTLFAGRPQGYRGELDRLAGRAPGTSAGTLPIVVSADLAARLAGRPLSLVLGSAFRRAEVVGTASVSTQGWLPGPVVYADAAAAAADLPELARPNLLLAEGPGADAAARALPGVTAAQLHSRAGWLAQMRGSTLLAEVLRLFWLAIVALAGFAALALLATVLGGARERAGALSTLRTLGLSAGQGRWLVVGELAPLVVAGAGAGAVAGLFTITALGPTLGLVALTGGLGDPALSLRPLFVVGVLGGLVLLFVLAALAEVAVHRRDRLAEVLRVGDVR
jgi:putative ABC transport system permease protein